MKEKDVITRARNSEDNKPQKWMNINKLKAAILKFSSLFRKKNLYFLSFLILTNNKYSAIYPQEKSTEIVVCGRGLTNLENFFFLGVKLFSENY